jgi:hypothetical protein
VPHEFLPNTDFNFFLSSELSVPLATSESVHIIERKIKALGKSNGYEPRNLRKDDIRLIISIKYDTKSTMIL